MKHLIIYSLILLTSTNVLAQKSKYSISIIQNNEKVKIKNREAKINKSPFVICYKFKEGKYNWSLVAGSNEVIEDAFLSDDIFLDEFIQNAEFGGADGNFNEDRSIRAWDGEICTTIIFENMENHRFDSINKKGKMIYGYRTVEHLSTKNDNFLVEDWPFDNLTIATALDKFEDGEHYAIQSQGINLILQEKPNEFPYIVKGKTYVEEGESIHEEGCEGCGNLGSYKFLSNGKEVDFYRSGSDTGGFGEYTQKGDQVVIIKGELSFTVSGDGKYMTHNKYGTIYNLVKK